MEQKREKKIALITGAASGLGFALSNLLSSESFHVIGVSKNLQGLEDLKKSLLKNSNPSFDLIMADLKDQKQVKDLSELILKRWGYLNVLIHCAAQSSGMAPANIMFDRDFSDVFLNNVLSTKYIIAHTDGLLKASGNGKAIFIDDTISKNFLSTYSASKAAIRDIVLCYKRENSRLGPTISLFSPKPMPTKLRRKFFPGESETKLFSCFSQAKALRKLI